MHSLWGLKRLKIGVRAESGVFAFVRSKPEGTGFSCSTLDGQS